jgi:hypothetical protein
LDRTLAVIDNHGLLYAFIDAVIAWENLFGTGDTQELAYRVSMTMASIMSDDVNKRIRLQREIKRLYSLRSRVVHGGYHPNPRETAELWEKAWVYTVLAITELIEHHSDLLGARADVLAEFVLGASKEGP